MSVRVVVYAEGSGEAPRLFDDSPAWTLGDDDLGPAHVLVRRSLAAERGVPESAVVFRGRYRDEDGCHLVGSDLLDDARRARLAALHALFADRIDLVVLLVDRDGHADRTPAALGASWTGRTALAVGVPREEFEAWLIGDGSAAARRLGAGPPGLPEALAPRAAKMWLSEQVSAVEGVALEIRCDLARAADLTSLRAACPSFSGSGCATTLR